MVRLSSLLALSQWQAVIIVVAAVVVLLAAFIIVTAAMLNVIIFSRQDRTPKYKYFTSDDFGIQSEDFPVTYRGVDLYAKVYHTVPLEECSAVVIFQHGFGAGTASYMTEIAHFARKGFAVVAADAYGCDHSAGKGVLGFYAGAEAVIAAYIAVKSDKRLSNKKLVTVGHSWGAYSVLAASDKISTDGVVALSAFNKPASCICDQLKNMKLRFSSLVLKPGFAVLNFFRFGINGNASAAKHIKKSGIKALLIHGEDDKVVPYKHSAAKKAEGQNIKKLVLQGKRHNPYATAAAEEKLKELSAVHSFESEEEEDSYYASFDWNAATEEDASVMSEIDSFILSL